MKIFNIVVLKKLRCNIKRKLKFNGAYNCFHLPYLPISYTTCLHGFNFIKRIKIPRAEICDVTIVYKKFGHTMYSMAMVPTNPLYRH